MEKGTDYYIYMGGVKGCNADLTLGGAGTIYAYDADINEPASYKVLSEKNSQQINATSPEDVQWLKFVVLEDGKYKLSYKEETMHHVCSYLDLPMENLHTKLGTVIQQMIDLIMI